ncbi:uncharacterized protein LOC129917939 [Episyrphus balteatus]|uniref:uncharacterized protein LOC129917939 n=1 Tax=Episyrphus balteatus TaxID=286459 RepID=UPI00248516AC|nr:uncharacterized protein LOC129917939 [Episyrphus balteatus]
MAKFNADELNAPKWMDEKFFEDVLKKYEKTDNISVTEIKLSPASAQGDHYASIMFRCAVTYDTNKSKGNTKSLIIKTMPEIDGFKKDFLAESHIFETEIPMYAETIPKFHAELKKIDDDTVLGLEPLYHSLEPRKIIVFEDICPKGYEVLRNRKITMEETKAAYLKLAKWHAVSYKLAAEGDTSITNYEESFLNFKDVEQMPFLSSGLENFIDKLQTVEDLKQYVPKLQGIKKDLIKSCISSGKSYRQKGSEGIFVLCHGDFHRKNMMFKKSSSGKFEDVMLLDFQISYFGPAILDVLYGMYVLADRDVRLNHYDELIHFYSSNFIETLKKLKFQGNIPKISDFFIEILHHRHWGKLYLTFLYFIVKINGFFRNAFIYLILTNLVCNG